MPAGTMGLTRLSTSALFLRFLGVDTAPRGPGERLRAQGRAWQDCRRVVSGRRGLERGAGVRSMFVCGIRTPRTQRRCFWECFAPETQSGESSVRIRDERLLRLDRRLGPLLRRSAACPGRQSGLRRAASSPDQSPTAGPEDAHPESRRARHRCHGPRICRLSSRRSRRIPLQMRLGNRPTFGPAAASGPERAMHKARTFSLDVPLVRPKARFPGERRPI